MNTSSTSTTKLLVLNELVGNQPVTLNPLQQALSPYVPDIALVWIALWCTTAIVILRHLYRELRRTED